MITALPSLQTMPHPACLRASEMRPTAFSFPSRPILRHLGEFISVLNAGSGAEHNPIRSCKIPEVINSFVTRKLRPESN